MITRGEYAAAGLHELRNGRLLRCGKGCGVEPEQPNLVVVCRRHRRRRSSEIEVAGDSQIRAAPVTMRGGYRMPHALNDGYELGKPEVVGSEVEATVCHHKNLLWARKLPDDFPKLVAMKLMCKVMHCYLLLAQVDGIRRDQAARA